MWEFIIDHLGVLAIGGIIGIGLLIGTVQRLRERKYRGKDAAEEDVLGTAGKVMGNTIYRGMPTDITGMPPSGHFQKPDFSCDEEAERIYSEKYEGKRD